MEQEINKHQQEIFNRFVEGTCSPAEMQELLDHFGTADAGELHHLIRHALEDDQADEESTSPVRQAILSRVHRRLAASIFPVKSNPRFRWYYAAAAVLVVMFAIALYFYTGVLVNRHAEIASEIGPGYNQATLTLADGTIVALDSAQSGIIAKDEDIKYNDGNSVLEKKGRGPRAPGTYNVERTTYNSLSTPRGGQYQIILADGTKVWLNAASTLKYPSRFIGDKRVVFLEGEAYFEVVKTKTTKGKSGEIAAPFIVKTRNQEVTVLGTSFNLAVYPDESSIQTTLVSGSVQVGSPGHTRGDAMINERLKPGQQAINTNGDIQVKTADVETATAWLHGKFIFESEALDVIMRQVARWYNVDVNFLDPSLRSETFEGVVTRYSHISEVLDMLEEAGDVKFSVRGHTVNISKK